MAVLLFLDLLHFYYCLCSRRPCAGIVSTYAVGYGSTMADKPAGEVSGDSEHTSPNILGLNESAGTFSVVKQANDDTNDADACTPLRFCFCESSPSFVSPI